MFYGDFNFKMPYLKALQNYFRICKVQKAATD